MSVAILEQFNEKALLFGSLNLTEPPTINNSNTNFIVRNAITGQIELNTTSSSGGVSGATNLGTGQPVYESQTGSILNFNTLSNTSGNIVISPPSAGNLNIDINPNASFNSITTGTANIDFLNIFSPPTVNDTSNVLALAGSSVVTRDNVVDTTSVQSITGTKSFSKLNTLQLYGITGSSPTVALGPGAGGTGSAVSILGNDLVGEIAITVGAAPTSSVAIVATITMSTASATRPQPLISFTGPSTPIASLPGVITASFQSSNSWAIINFGTTALTAGVTYSWNYFVPSL
jgi:hypothetical protein